jgi:hypothetical protein
VHPLLLAVLAGPALAQDPGAPPSPPPAADADASEPVDPVALQARVDELEQQLADLALAIELSSQAAAAPSPAPAPRGGGAGQSMNPDISLIADVAAAYFTADEPLQTGGHDPTANGFNLQQLEMSIQSTVDPYFKLDANIVFSLFGVEVEEAYATTLGLPLRSQLRIGQMLTRFGRLNNSHPHGWDFVDQPFVLGRVMGGEGNRGLGIEGSALLPLPWYVELVASETMAAGEASARSFYGAQDLGVQRLGDLQTTVALKQFFPLSDDWSLFWGLSWAGGPNSTGRDNRSELYGSDLYLKWRPISRASTGYVALQAEGIHRRRQVPGDVLVDWNAYEQLTWRMARRWAVAGRHEIGTAATTIDGELAGELDALDPEWTSTRQRITAATTFWPTEFSRLRLQGATDLVGWREEPDWSVFLAFEFSVGAHGAHAF